MPARNRKGQFVKGGGGRKRSRSRARATVALAVRESVTLSAPRRRSPVRYRPAAAPRRRRRRGGFLSGGGGGTSVVGVLRSKLPGMVGSAAYGWITQAPTSQLANTARNWLNKVPTISAIGVPASHGVLFAFIASKTSGRIRQIADALGTAALYHFAHNVGAAEFDFAKGAVMSGGDDLSGEMGADEDMRGDED